MTTQLNPSIDKRKVEALINWYNSELVMNEYNCSYNMNKLNADNKLLIKEYKRRTQMMQLNWDEFCHVADTVGVMP